MPLTARRTPRQQANLEAIARETTNLCPLPAIATRLIDMAASARFSAHDLATAINADQALTAKVLRVANSPFYGMPRRSASLRDAVVLLSFRQVRTIALAACVIGASGRPDNDVLDYGQFWRNSLIVGILAQVLSEAEASDRDAAFTAGVSHNIDRLPLAQRRRRDFVAVLDRAGAVALALIGLVVAASRGLVLGWMGCMERPRTRSPRRARRSLFLGRESRGAPDRGHRPPRHRPARATSRT